MEEDLNNVRADLHQNNNSKKTERPNQRSCNLAEHEI